MVASPIRVLLVAHSSQYSLGGLSRYEHELYQNLARIEGIEVRVTVAPLPAPGLLGTMKKVSGLDLSSFLTTYPVLVPPDSTDVLHLLRSGYATMLSRSSRGNVFVTVHDILHYIYRDAPQLTYYRNPVERWFDLTATRNLRRATGIVASSNATKYDLINYLNIDPQRIFVVPLGVDHAIFRPSEIDDEFLDRFGLRATERYAVYVGSDERRKNLVTLLQAWRHIIKQYPDAVLLKVGAPLYLEERRRLVRLLQEYGVEKNVRLVEGVTDEELARFYTLARMCILPSIAEGFGFPVLEAMACGTPVVCSDTPALRELAGDAAILVPALEPDQLADAIGAVLSDDRASQRMSAAGTARAATFTWERTAGATAAAYQAVMARG